MDKLRLTAISNATLTFITFLGVLIALISFLISLGLELLQVLLLAIIYIDWILLFIYYIMRR